MGLKKPLEIKLQLTEECNFNCGFCFNRQGNTAKGILPREKAEQTISKVSDAGIERIRFTGGEPLLHKDFLPLLRLAKAKGLCTMLNTNASLISKEKAKEIGANADNVLVSIHSLQPGQKVLEAAELLSGQGCFLRAATILTKENIGKLEEFHALVQEMPFAQWVLLRQIPNSLNKEPISQKEMQAAIEKIESFNRARKKKDWFLIENALPFCCFDPERVSKVALGGIHEDGHSSLFVAADASIRPSYFFDIVLGNAGKDNFLDAWESDFVKRMNSLEFIAETCHKCKYVIKCMSGSRFSALLASKSLYGLDPLARPNLFLEKLERNK